MILIASGLKQHNVLSYFYIQIDLRTKLAPKSQMEFTPAKKIEAWKNGELKQKCACIAKYEYKAQSEKMFWTSNREYSSHNHRKEENTKAPQDYFAHVRKNKYSLVII